MKKVILGLASSALFLMSCSNNIEDTITNETNNKNLRKQYLEVKSNNEMKSYYIKSDKETKIALWNEKLTQILNQEIDKKTFNLVAELKNEINREVVNFATIRELGLSLANILPEDKFIAMFYTLDNFNSNLPYSKIPVSEELKEQIKNAPMSFGNVQTYRRPNVLQKYPIDCSCEWTCSSFCPDGSTDQCNPTSSGCGFMWASPCEHACSL